jgi:hypothetical protein
MRFTKIKLLGEQDTATVSISYQTAVSGGFADHTEATPESPHPDFINAMAGLAPGVLKIAELEGVSEAEDITVRGLSFTHHKNGRTSLIITALRELKNSGSPLLINTPHKLLEVSDDSDDAQTLEILDKDIALKVDLICSEARAFIVDTKRAQGDLFKKSEPKPNGRRPRAEDGFQPDQPELEMETIGGTVPAVMEALVGDGTSLEELNQNIERGESNPAIYRTNWFPPAEQQIHDSGSVIDSLSDREDLSPNGDLEAAFGADAADERDFEERKKEDLEKVQSWLDYKEYCGLFKIPCRKVEFEALMASRNPVDQPGYRDPGLRNEIAERRRGARLVTAEAQSRLPSDDLLG